MQDNSTSIQDLKDLIADFVDKRDWNQFHTPKKVLMEEKLTGIILFF